MGMPSAMADTPGSTPPARRPRKADRDSDSHAEASEEGGYERPDQVGHCSATAIRQLCLEPARLMLR